VVVPVQVKVEVDPARDLFTHPFFEPPPRRRRRPRVIWLRRRSRGGRFLLFLLGTGVAGLLAALTFGWRPPLAWRQSELWHRLDLPYAE
jgi:hypothetical protein